MKPAVFYGWCILVGSVLFALAALFHPVMVDPWDTNGAMDKISRSRHWVEDHAAIAAAIVLWLTGLSGSARRDGSDADASSIPLAGRLYMGALAVWLVVLAMEIAEFPLLLPYAADHADVAIVAKSFSAFGLLTGYFAMGLVWLAVFLSGGRLVGALALSCTVLALLLPHVALWFLAGTLPAYVWTVALGWRMAAGRAGGIRRGNA